MLLDLNASWITSAIQNVLAFKYARKKLIKCAEVTGEATKEYVNSKSDRANNKKTSGLNSWDHVVGTNAFHVNKISNFIQINCLISVYLLFRSLRGSRVPIWWSVRGGQQQQTNLFL